MARRVSARLRGQPRLLCSSKFRCLGAQPGAMGRQRTPQRRLLPGAYSVLHDFISRLAVCLCVRVDGDQEMDGRMDGKFDTGIQREGERGPRKRAHTNTHRHTDTLNARARARTHTHTHTQDEGDSVPAIASLQRKPPRFEDEKANAHPRALLARTSMSTESSGHRVFGIDGARSAVAVRSTVANRSTDSELLPTARPFFATMPGVRAVQLRQIRRQNTQNNSRATMH